MDNKTRIRAYGSSGGNKNAYRFMAQTHGLLTLRCGAKNEIEVDVQVTSEGVKVNVYDNVTNDPVESMVKAFKQLKTEEELV